MDAWHETIKDVFSMIQVSKIDKEFLTHKELSNADQDYQSCGGAQPRSSWHVTTEVIPPSCEPLHGHT